MNRAYLPPEQWTDESRLALDAEEAHHLLHVLRVKPGDTVEALDGAGRTAQTVLRGGGCASGGCALEIQSIHHVPPAPVDVILYQALLKPAAMDGLIQKSAELGVTAVQPIATERSVVKVRGGQAEKKRERWHKMAIGAAKQCGYPYLMRVEAPIRLDDALNNRPEGVLLVGSLESNAEPLATILETYRAAADAPVRWLCAIGPEGDFTPEEYNRLRDAGGRAAAFGDRVFRAETAALYLASLLYYYRAFRNTPGA